MVRRFLTSVLALLLLGGCGGSTSDAEVPAGVMSPISGFSEASSTYDTASMRTFLTDDFTWQSTGPVQELQGFLDYVDRYWEAAEFRWEATGEAEISLDGDTYVVEEPGIATAKNMEMVGTTRYRLVESEGEWLIQEVRWVGAPTSESEG